MSVWLKVRESLAAGEDPIVTLSYATHLEPFVPKKRGRKAKPRHALFVLNREKPVLVTKRPRCWNPYCKKRLTNGAVHVCNDGCKALAVEHLQTALSLLQDPMMWELAGDVPDVAIFRVAGEAIRDRARERREAEAGQQTRPRGRRPKAVAARAGKGA